MKVSIIIPYNIDRGWLSEAVRSCEHQEEWRLNKDYEIIVEQGHCNVGVNFNRAVEKARGEYIKGCAEDDMLAPGCLKTLYPFAVNGCYDLVCADAFSFQVYGKPLTKDCSTIPDTVSHLAEVNTIHGGTILYRKSAMPRWNEEYWTAEEYDISLRMAAAGCKFGKIDEVVYWYRSHPAQKSQQFKFTENGNRAIERFHFIHDNIIDPNLNNGFRIVR